MQNEMRRVAKTNLEHKASRLRMEIESLTRTICVNLDTSMKPPENLPISDVDSQFDELKQKWAELNMALGQINRLTEELR
jgi:hypothetical protein